MVSALGTGEPARARQRRPGGSLPPHPPDLPGPRHRRGPAERPADSSGAQKAPGSRNPGSGDGDSGRPGGPDRPAATHPEGPPPPRRRGPPPDSRSPGTGRALPPGGQAPSRLQQTGTALSGVFPWTGSVMIESVVFRRGRTIGRYQIRKRLGQGGMGRSSRPSPKAGSGGRSSSSAVTTGPEFLARMRPGGPGRLPGTPRIVRLLDCWEEPGVGPVWSWNGLRARTCAACWTGRLLAIPWP